VQRLKFVMAGDDPALTSLATAHIPLS
jgi:hypothetical protein